MTDEQMIADVAKAIYAKHPTLMFYDRPGSPPGNQYLDWEHAPQGCRDRAIEQARAAHSVIAGKVTELAEALRNARVRFTILNAEAVLRDRPELSAKIENWIDAIDAALAPYPERRSE